MQNYTFKNKTRKCFDNGAKTYDSVSFMQDKYSCLLSKIIKKRMQFLPKKILDIGCGTGTTSFFLKKIYPQADFFLNDISQSMLDIAQKKIYPKQIICSDADVFNFEACDLLISNFSLHWLNDPLFFLSRALNFARCLCCTVLLEGTFSSWYSLVGRPAKDYVSEKALDDLFISSNVQFYDILYFEEELNFSAVSDFVRYINFIGANSYLAEKKKVFSALRNFKGKIITSYKIALFFVENKKFI